MITLRGRSDDYKNSRFRHDGSKKNNKKVEVN